MTHNEAMDLIRRAASVTTLSYEEAVAIYLRARGILMDGQEMLGVDTAVRLARAFGVSLDYMTGLSDNAPTLHPEALRIACEIDVLLSRKKK